MEINESIDDIKNHFAVCHLDIPREVGAITTRNLPDGFTLYNSLIINTSYCRWGRWYDSASNDNPFMSAINENNAVQVTLSNGAYGDSNTVGLRVLVMRWDIGHSMG